MSDETLERQMENITKKLQERDEAERKKIEQEWRKAMERDTAGHLLGIFQFIQTQIANLQAQIDATSPIASLVRGIAELNMRLVALETAIKKMEEQSGA